MSRLNIIGSFEQKFSQTPQELFEFLSNAPRKYKVYHIPKRTSGTRIIAQPTPELKEYQRYLVSLIDPILPVHQYCIAYRKGKSIKNNALLHCNNSFFLKMDFSNFFNSITPQLLWSMCENNNLEFSWLDKDIIEKVVFWQPNKYSEKLILSIGAPSSPLISNFCMYDFDLLLSEYCLDKKITFSRYADDLSFSTNIAKVLFDIPSVVEEKLKKVYGNAISINHLKTVFSSKKNNRHITGITITNDGFLSLGRNKKRYIKHLIHNYILGDISDIDLKYLKGYLNFAQHIEPVFLMNLEKKYSKNTLYNLRLGDK